MSSFPSSKSSFRRATQGCCALMLAGAMVLPMTPALAQDTAPVTNISVPNAPVANTASPVSQDVTDGRLSPLIMGRVRLCTPMSTTKLR